MMPSTGSLIPVLEKWAIVRSPSLRDAGFSLKVDESRINADKQACPLPSIETIILGS